MASSLAQALLEKFDASYDTGFEDEANEVRGDFLQAFPLARLKKITLDKYIIGKGTPSFCAFVEAKTRAWANILGATSFKFGIYFGRTKTDPAKRYRYTSKFGSDTHQAFANVKAALLDLVDAGQHEHFDRIDDNPLSQMFKAKILSLYFPEKFLNVCSGEHIRDLSSELGIADGLYLSEQQHLLLKAKEATPKTKNWSNPKFITFLYNTFIRSASQAMHLKASPRKPRKVDIEALLENRKRVGEMSEALALKWEKRRLSGAGLKNFIKKIEDRRGMPSYGYDFFSHSSPSLERYIEVKSIGKNRIGSGFRFFLSENEWRVSCKNPEKYYFYLVQYGENGQPAHVSSKKASDFYDFCELGPNGYVVTFDIEQD